MIYIYDDAIAEDLRKSFNPYNTADPVVKVIDPEAAIGIAAQIQNDNIQFPLVVLNRNPDTPIDKDRLNFTKLHKGSVAVLDPKTNNLYYERSIPINLRYAITILATNTADVDELVRELLFKYSSMYFVTITLPYEAERKIRIGIVIDPDSNVERSSGSAEYINGGKLYQAIVPLKCEGAVLVHYTPAHLRRFTESVHVVSKENLDENLI